MAACRKVHGARMNARQRALVQVALGVFTWRTLGRESGLKQGVAVAVMVRVVDFAGEDLKAAR